MTAQNLAVLNQESTFESLEDRIDILFHELELATKWQRPSVLLAIYSSDYIRADANIALENRLRKLGQNAYHINVNEQEDADLAELISELTHINNVVFFVEGLRWGAGLDDACTYRNLNKSREYFIENHIRIVFWLTEHEAIDLAHFAPDYWSFRHRVIEFVDTPSLDQIEPHIIEPSQNHAGEFTDSIEDLDAKITMRTALLDDLPNDSESTSARANLLLTLGVLHWRRGEFERASQFLNTALDLATTLEDARFEALCFNALALVLTNLGRLEDAVKAYKNAVSLSPERFHPWNNLGSLYKKLGRHAEALNAFQKSIDRDETDVIGWQGLGEAHHALGRNDEAINALMKATQISPNFSAAWTGLGCVYHSIGQMEDAVSAHQNAIKLDHSNGGSWLGLGRIYKEQGNPDGARTAFQTAIEVEPRNAYAWVELGDLAFKAGAHEEAMHSYQKAIEFGQGTCMVYRNLASINAILGHQEDTIPLLQKGISLTENPTVSACLWNRLGDSYREINDIENATSAYHQAEALDPEQSSSENDLVDDLSTLEAMPGNDSAHGIKVHEDQISIPLEHDSGTGESEVNEIKNDLSIVDDRDSLPDGSETMAREWLDGLSSVQPVIEIPADMTPLPLRSEEPGFSDSDTPEFIHNTSQNVTVFDSDDDLQESGGNPVESVSPTDQYDRLDADETMQNKSSDASIDINNARIWTELGTIYCNTEAFDEASNAFKKAVELDPTNGWMYNNLASLYFRQGKYAQAVPLYQKSIRYSLEPKDKALLWNRLGDTYRKLNIQDEAARAYGRAMDVNPEKMSLLSRARMSLLGNCRL